jgi:hypothetical protein
VTSSAKFQQNFPFLPGPGLASIAASSSMASRDQLAAGGFLDRGSSAVNRGRRITHDLVLSRLELRRFPDPVSVPVVACLWASAAIPARWTLAVLRPLLHAAQATLAAAKITARIGTALFGAGHASDAHFTAGCGPELYVAVTKQARQAGRPTAGKKPATRKDPWQKLAAKLDHSGPSRVPAAAPPGLSRYGKHKGLADDQPPRSDLGVRGRFP